MRAQIIFIGYFFGASIPGLFSTSGFAQKKCSDNCSCIITGHVIDDADDSPLPFVSVQIKGTTLGSLTDDNGFFEIKNLCQDEFDLVFSHIGYKSIIHHHDIYHPDLIVRLVSSELILESIVVEGDKYESELKSSTISELSGQDLIDVKTESFGDALANMTGVSTLKTGQNIVKPVLHGLHSNRVLIINNGIRHEGQQWGSGHAPEIDPSLAGNLKVLKGAATVKYGPDAMGGVLIIEPPSMELSTEHLHGDAGISYADNGRSLNADMHLQQGYENFAWRVQSSGLFQGDLYSPDYMLTNTGARELGYAMGIRYHKGKFDFTVDHQQVYQQLGILRGSVVGSLDQLDEALKSDEPFYTDPFSYAINTPHQKVKHELTRLKGQYYWHDQLLEFQYGYQINKRREFDIRRGNNNEKPAIDLELITHTFDLDWKHPKIDGWSGTLGAQWLYQDNNNIPGTNTVHFIPNYNNLRGGIFLIEHKKVGKLLLEGGLRYDLQVSSIRGRDQYSKLYSHDLFYQSISGIIGVETSVGPNLVIKSQVGTSWRPPNVAELYSYGKHDFVINYGIWRHDYSSSSDVVYNNKTRPVKNETGIKWINTFNYSKENNHLEITAYGQYITNYIYQRPAGVTETIRGPFPFFIYDQTNALYFGVDASYIVEHNSHLSSHFTGSFLNASDIKNKDVFTDTPPHSLGYKFNFSGHLKKSIPYTLGLNGQYHFKQYRAPRTITIKEILSATEKNQGLFLNKNHSFDYIHAPKGYFLLHFSGSISYNRFTLRVRVKNLLNQKYRDYNNLMRYFADATGRNILLSLRYNF